MTREEALALHSKPENAERHMVIVTENGGDFVATYKGVEHRSCNMFGLDSKLAEAGAPEPRNLYLVED